MVKGTDASINCCKCIIGQSSKGNEKYIGRYPDVNVNLIGVLPFP